MRFLLQDVGVPDKVPEVEWWDAAILKNGVYDAVDNNDSMEPVDGYTGPLSDYQVTVHLSWLLDLQNVVRLYLYT